jgi:hypothetical protein
LIGSPGFCKARSKMAWRAYSPLTEMFIGVEFASGSELVNL